MTLLQPWILFGLPLILLPVLIHFLNRLRYRTMHWGAMMFLLSVSRSSTKFARVRHLLILLMRMLAVAALILALCRPLVGGWLGTALTGTPDTIIILLDGSASMETRDRQNRFTKRDQAMRLLARAGGDLALSSRFVFIENRSLAARELRDPAALPDGPFNIAASTASDMPAMFQAALDYMTADHPGYTEIWVASDLQSGDWQPQSGRWQSIVSQARALPQKLTIRLMALNWTPEANAALNVVDVKRAGTAAQRDLYITFDVSRQDNEPVSLPLTVNLNGRTSRTEINLERAHERLTHRIPLRSANEGWGYLSLPADDNTHDNTGYFVYGDDIRLATAIVSANPDAARILKLASAPSPEKLQLDARVYAPDAARDIDYDKTSLLVWQAPLPHGAAQAAIEQFLANDGVVVFFPPGTADTNMFLDVAWNDVDRFASNQVVQSWTRDEGPVADSASGDPLPVDEIAIIQRQLLRATADFTTLAAYSDRFAFLSRSPAENAYFCSTLPLPDWSTLHHGMVFVPMMQRMVQQGGRRLLHADMQLCGDWARDAAPWVSLDDPGKNPSYESGVYQADGRLLALNTPPAESAPDVLEVAGVRTLLEGLPLRSWEDTTSVEGMVFQSEIWRVFFFAMLGCMIAESLLTLPTRKRAGKNKQAGT